MNAVTLKALRGSIAKWQKIVKDTRALDKGQENCALCKKFFHLDCEGCPVRKVTGRPECRGSPYSEWVDHKYSHPGAIGFHRHNGCAECLRLAKAELTFLKSLLPKGVKASLRE